jgi:hypothetical protein
VAHRADVLYDARASRVGTHFLEGAARHTNCLPAECAKDACRPPDSAIPPCSSSVGDNGVGPPPASGAGDGGGGKGRRRRSSAAAEVAERENTFWAQHVQMAPQAL